MKKSTVVAVMLAGMTFSQSVFANIPAEFSWASAAVNFCVSRNIMQGIGGGNLALGGNLTREQMAKMLVEAFGKKMMIAAGTSTFSDIAFDRWSYMYIESFKPYMKTASVVFNPEVLVTREEFAASLVLISGLNENSVRNRDILEDNFIDVGEVSPIYKNLLCIAVERGYMKGSGGYINPKKLLTRAEACTLIHRVLEGVAGNIKLELGVQPLELTMIGEPTVSLERAKAWARNRGAHQRYIDIADIYWQYGAITGIRPEILYAQAAKETNFGKYTGSVVPEQNNWAGIKTAKASGDATYDHESFATPEDGVRAHFNHMSAYLGLAPVGEPHGRYYTVKSLTWAGSVRLLAELGGKWCPDLYYGYSIYNNYLVPMQNVSAV